MSESGRERPGGRRNEARDPYAREGRANAPESVVEALASAQRHGRTAVAEALLAIRALIDAASLASGGRSSDAGRLLGPIVKLFESVAGELAGGALDGSSKLLEAIVAAVDDEIAIWEERARHDTEARTVLRAFLGLREVLWEFGARSGAAPGGPRTASAQSAPKPPRRPAKSARPRVQRIPVEG